MPDMKQPFAECWLKLVTVSGAHSRFCRSAFKDPIVVSQDSGEVARTVDWEVIVSGFKSYLVYSSISFLISVIIL